MALRKNTDNTTVDNTTVDNTTVDNTTVDNTTVDIAPTINTPAVVKPTTTGTPAPSLISLRHSGRPIHSVEACLKVDGASIVEKVSKLDFGSWIDIQVVATYSRFQVQPDCTLGHPNNKYYRESYDKLTISSEGDEDGLLIADYMADLAGVCEFKKQLGQRLDIFAIILGADKEDAAAKASSWTIVRVDVSKAGIASYVGLESTSNIAIARGTLPIDKQNCIRLSVAKKQGKTTSYTHLNAGLIPLNMIGVYTAIPMPN